MAGDIVISTINGGAIGTKNVVINGNFGINQRGVSGTVVLAAGVYGHDRFKAGASGCTYTFATVDNVTTLTISAGSFVQVVEGLNLQSGTYTLSWTGTAQGKINGGPYAGSGLTGTATGGTNLNVEFNTGTISFVQLEKGSTATSFDYRDYGRELSLCQRYYCSLSIGRYWIGGWYMSSDYTYPTTMRAVPTRSLSSVQIQTNISTTYFSTGIVDTERGGVFVAAAGTTALAQYLAVYLASAEL
jgi:hypothetical protein